MELLTTAVVGVGVLAGMPVVPAALLVAAVWEPWLVGAALGVVAVLRRTRDRGPVVRDEAVFLSALAAELRGGATIRQAIVDAASRSPQLDLAHAKRLAGSGGPILGVAEGVATALPVSGSVAAPAIRLAMEHGGRAAGMFERLALRVVQRSELEAEVDVATAQARLSVKVLVALPLGLVALLIATGQIGALVEAGGVGRFLVGFGLVLQAAGVLAVTWLLRRAAL